MIFTKCPLATTVIGSQCPEVLHEGGALGLNSPLLPDQVKSSTKKGELLLTDYLLLSISNFVVFITPETFEGSNISPNFPKQ